MGAAAEIWISGSGMIAVLSPRHSARAASSACAPPHADRRAKRGQRVSAEPAPVWRSVERDESRVDRGLIERVEADERGGDFVAIPRSASCTSRPPNRLPPSRLSIASRRRARRRPAQCLDRGAVAQGDLSFDRRPAAGSQMRRAISD